MGDELKDDISRTDKWYRTAFHYACMKGHFGIVKLLMDRDDLDINGQDYQHGTALQYACTKGHIEIVKLLMDRDDLNINIRDDGGFTAFHFACMKGQIEIVKLLVDRNDLDINMQDREAFQKFIAFRECSPRIPRDDIVMIGAKLCAKCQLHPSELLGEENRILYNELTSEITNTLSLLKKSARK